MSEVAKRASSLLLRFRRVVSLVGQILLVVLSNWVAFMLRFDSVLPPLVLVAFWQMLPWLVAIRALTFVPFGLYSGLWRYTSIYDLRALVGGVTASSIVFYALVRSPLGPDLYPRSVIVIDALLLLLLLGAIRLVRRVAGEFSHPHTGRRVLIVGAGDAGELIVRDMKNNGWYAYQPIGFVDDNQAKVGLRIHGIPVLGTTADLPDILERHHPAEVLIAIPRVEPDTIRSIVRRLEPFKIPIKTLPNLGDILSGKVDLAQIRNLAVDDLLDRAPVGLDPKPLHRLIEGRRVMVTGAGGSIGAELCRQIARLRPASLVMFERYENSLHAIRIELEDQKLSFGVIPVIGDVTDVNRLNSVMQAHRPEIIFHAAAHKHVPLMEENPCEAVKNNVRGTRVLAQAAEGAGVDRVIIISTDKAVNPTSVMGASKRLAEMAIQAQDSDTRTSFSIVRFGNVLGSNGSVVPRFIEQIRKGGPVTVTHPEIRRFFMLIPEAVQLVLHAAAQAESGATYVLDMGEQVKIVDIARDLIRLSGLVPDEDIKIEFTGLRRGEKLFEELVGPDEQATPSRVQKILCVRSRHPPPPALLAELDDLEEDASLGRSEIVVEKMRALVGHLVVPAESESAWNSGARSDRPAPDAAMHEHFGGGEAPCPRCGGNRLHRSRARSIPDRIHRGLSAKRLFRCHDCGWRGWLLPRQAPVRPLEAVATTELSLLDHQANPEAPASTTKPQNLG